MAPSRPVLREVPERERVLPIDRAQCSCATMRRAARAITRLYDDALSPSGLRLTQFSLLANLDRYGKVPMVALTEILDVDRTTLTRNLAPLEREDLLEILPSARGRAKVVALTSRGRKRLLDAFPLWQQAQDRFGSVVGPQRTDDLLHLAQELTAMNT